MFHFSTITHRNDTRNVNIIIEINAKLSLKITDIISNFINVQFELIWSKVNDEFIKNNS